MIIILLLLLSAVTVQAQHWDPSSVGRAGVHDLMRKGGSALQWNPAVLGRMTDHRGSVDFLSLGAASGNNAFSVNFWNDHLAGDRFFTGNDKDEILDQIPSDGLCIDAQASIPLVGFSYDRFGANIALDAASHTAAPKDLITLALLGNRIGHTYRFDDVDEDSHVLIDYSLGFGYEFEQTENPRLYIGAAFHFYQGIAMSHIGESEGSLLVTDSTITGVAILQELESNQGDGAGFDVGGMAVFSEKWQVGLSVRQIGTEISWKLDEERFTTFSIDSAGIIVDSLDDDDYLERVFETQDVRFKGDAYGTKLPVILQANGRFAPSRRWTLLGEMLIRMSDTVQGERGLEAGVGAVFTPLPWLRLQSGVSLGGPWKSRFALGGGVSFGRYELDIGGSWNNGLLNEARGVTIGLGQRIYF